MLSFQQCYLDFLTTKTRDSGSIESFASGILAKQLTDAIGEKEFKNQVTLIEDELLLFTNWLAPVDCRDFVAFAYKWYKEHDLVTVDFIDAWDTYKQTEEGAHWFKLTNPKTLEQAIKECDETIMPKSKKHVEKFAKDKKVADDFRARRLATATDIEMEEVKAEVVETPAEPVEKPAKVKKSKPENVLPIGNARVEDAKADAKAKAKKAEQTPEVKTVVDASEPVEKALAVWQIDSVNQKITAAEVRQGNLQDIYDGLSSEASQVTNFEVVQTKVGDLYMDGEGLFNTNKSCCYVRSSGCLLVGNGLLFGGCGSEGKSLPNTFSKKAVASEILFGCVLSVDGALAFLSKAGKTYPINN